MASIAPKWLAEAFADPGIRTVRAVLVFFFHVVTMAAVLLGMKVIQLLVEWLWSGQHIMVFGEWDLDWLFQLIDVALIVVVGFFGVGEAIAVYRRPISPPKREVEAIVVAEVEEET
ncbi:MAG TPA: hypothetical protein VGG99_03925 [Acetobacteraceae bacterium]|jgi:hypothetical protein